MMHPNNCLVACDEESCTCTPKRHELIANLQAAKPAGNACLYDHDDVAFPKGFMLIDHPALAQGEALLSASEENKQGTVAAQGIAGDLLSEALPVVAEAFLRVLKSPETAYADHFNTPERANAVLVGLCQDAAAEISKLLEHVGIVNRSNEILLDEVERLNKWADGFTDAHLKERQTGDALVKELQGTIAKLDQRVVDLGGLYMIDGKEKRDASKAELTTLRTQLSDTTGQVGRLREALEEKTREADYNFALYQDLGAQADNHPIDFDLFREVSLIHQKHADWEAITTLSIDDPSYDTFASGFKTAVGVIEQYMNLNSTAQESATYEAAQGEKEAVSDRA